MILWYSNVKCPMCSWLSRKPTNGCFEKIFKENETQTWSISHAFLYFASNLHPDCQDTPAQVFSVNFTKFFFGATASGFYRTEIPFVIFKSLSYCFKETIGSDLKASLAGRPVSRLIRWCNKPGEITREFWEKAVQFQGAFHRLETINWYRKTREKRSSWNDASVLSKY